jgi:cytochrome c oxidase subunit 4
MSATPETVEASPAEHSKFHVFVQVALVLSAITGVEIVLVYLPFAKWLLVTALVVLSAVKFLFVIFVFMHLKWDRLFCTILFFIGLTLALGTVLALIAVAAADASKPLETALLLRSVLGRG